MNDILTSTVSRVFPNTSRHLSLFRFEEEASHREVPKSSRKEQGFEDKYMTKEKERDFSSAGIVTNLNNLLEGKKGNNLISNFSNTTSFTNKNDNFNLNNNHNLNNTHSNKNSGTALGNSNNPSSTIKSPHMPSQPITNNPNSSSLNYENWKNYESKIKLSEAMKRLNVDESKCKNKNMINLNLDFLINEKTKVKSELKKFDNDFFEAFHRYPNRDEKEIMRVIYMYYKNLKQAIETKQEKEGSNININKNNSAKHSHNNSNVSHTGNNSSINQTNLYQGTNSKTYNSSFDNNSVINHQKKTLKETVKENFNKKDVQNKNNFKPGTSSSDLESIINPNPSLNSNFNQRPNSNSINNNNDIFLDNFDFENPSSATGSVFKNNFSGNLTNPGGYSSHPMKDKKLTRTDLLNLEKEYSDIKKDQIELKEKLHAYQKEFYQIHNRRVKYYKDIIGIEGDYKRYKINKIKIKEIQEIILKYKNNK
jgi:hypothetical protein